MTTPGDDDRGGYETVPKWPSIQWWSEDDSGVTVPGFDRLLCMTAA